MAEISVMLNAGALSPATSSANSLPDGSYWEDVDMNILLLGSGGREHALAWKLAQSQKLTRLYARSEEHTSELQSLMRLSYAVFCLKKIKTQMKKQGIINKNLTTEIIDMEYRKINY